MLFWLSTCQIRMHCTRKHEQSEVLATSSEGKSPPLYYTVIKLLFCNRFCSFWVVGGVGGVLLQYLAIMLAPVHSYNPAARAEPGRTVHDLMKQSGLQCGPLCTVAPQ